MNTQVAEETSLTTRTSKSVEQDQQQKKTEKAIENLTKAWGKAFGKSIQGVFEMAKVLSDAHEQLGTADHQAWLKNVAKMSDGTASKYRSIHTAVRDTAYFTAHKEMLPPSYTALYELSRICNHDDLSPLKAEELFLEALAFVNGTDTATFPSVAQIASKVTDLLPEATAAAVKRIKAENEKYKADRAAAEQPPPQQAIPDSLTGMDISIQASTPLSEKLEAVVDSSEEEIAALQDELFADDGNEVLTESFVSAYDTLRLRNKIKALLHEENLTNIEVIVRQKVAA